MPIKVSFQPGGGLFKNDYFRHELYILVKIKIHWECNACIFSENQILAVRDHVSVLVEEESTYHRPYETVKQGSHRDSIDYTAKVAALSRFSSHRLLRILHRDVTCPKSGSLKKIRNLGGNVTNHDHILNSEPNMTSFERWIAIVNEYSGRNLSVSGDSLNAFSGVAQHLAERGWGAYVAGIWKSYIFQLRGLLWVQIYVAPAVRNRESGKIQKRLYCPSWSWASVGGKIEYYNWRDWNEDIRPHTEIVDHTVLQAYEVINKAKVESLKFRLSNDKLPYGDVSKGVLMLRGQWGYLPRKIACNDWNTRAKPAICITMDTVIKEEHGMEYLSNRLIRSRSQPLNLSPIRLNKTNVGNPSWMPFCIRIFDVVRNTRGRGVDYVYESWFIILQQLGDNPEAEECMFRRVGIGHYSDIWDHASVHEWESIWRFEERIIRIM